MEPWFVWWHLLLFEKQVGWWSWTFSKTLLLMTSLNFAFAEGSCSLFSQVALYFVSNSKVDQLSRQKKKNALKEVCTWNKGKIYTVSLFLAQLFFWFSPFKKRVFCQPHCEHWQEWPKQILFAMILILMTQDYWTWVGGSNFCWKWLPWWHVKIRWWVLRIRRKWWLANIDVFPKGIYCCFWPKKQKVKKSIKKHEKMLFFCATELIIDCCN